MPHHDLNHPDHLRTRWNDLLDAWLAPGPPAARAGAMLGLLSEVFADELIWPRPEDLPVRRSADGQDAPLLVVARDPRQDRPVLCVVPPSATTLTGSDVLEIRERAAELDPAWILALGNPPFHRDGPARELLRVIEGAPWVFLSWIDLTLAMDLASVGASPSCIPLPDRVPATPPTTREKTGFSWLPGQAPVDELADRSLPGLKHLLDRLDRGSLFADFGAGRGRHALYATRAGHHLLAVERRSDTFEDLSRNLNQAGVDPDRTRLVLGDYLDCLPADFPPVDLLAIVGVLQHATDEEDLRSRLRHLAHWVTRPGGMIYIEMLFDMRFDGEPRPGRVEIPLQGFEGLLEEVFAPADWSIGRVAGPVSQTLDFTGGGRSFFSDVRTVDQTSAEYLLTRRAPQP